jgi:hypothetical protein
MGSCPNMGSYPFTGAQAAIVTGDAVRAIVGDETADRLASRFASASSDADGLRQVDLGGDRLAVVNALRELSPDAPEAADQQASESLLKGLAGTG